MRCIADREVGLRTFSESALDLERRNNFNNFRGREKEKERERYLTILSNNYREKKSN